MFTGIISHLGTVKEIKADGLAILAQPNLVKQLKTGASIAVNGVCLTVTKIKLGKIFSLDIMSETWQKTMLADLAVGDKVNLELAMGITDRFDGHVVQGHGDDVARIKSLKKIGNSHEFNFSAPKNITGYLVSKGSIAINGISLTLVKVSRAGFSVSLIPHTFKNTNLASAKVGERVNIEIDILAKYIKTFLRH